MSDTQQGKGVYVPAAADLSRFDDVVQGTGGVFIKDIPANTILQIDVADAVFTVLVVDPAGRKIRIQGSQYIPELTDAIMSGSTFGGSFLKEWWIGIGMCLEILIPGREPPRLTTSMVQKISIVTNGTATVQ